MAEIIRAVYEQGQLRPLDPLALTNGQEIRLAILSEREQVRAALADLVAPIGAEQGQEVNEAALFATIDAALQGAPPISDAVLDERRGVVTSNFLDSSAIVKRYSERQE